MSGMLLLWLSGSPVHGASEPAIRPERLQELSLEELADIEITSVARRPQKLQTAASAIFVITQQDIRRSGATSIAAALRLAPNLQVARTAFNQYAISARGFNSTTANKLLVLIDGRSVYTPLFSGVFWDAQDTLMEDIERIEVISGSGATLWGANAVNGIINVITRDSADTGGNLASAHLGSEEKGGAFRHGGKLADGASYRIYGKALEHDASVSTGLTRLQDAGRLAQAGFRFDHGVGEQNLVVQGDLYQGSSEQPVFDRRRFDGGNLLGRWRSRLQDGSELSIQTYYDYTKRVYPGTFSESLNTIDLDMQHGFKLGERHEIVWGGGYRYSDDRVGNSAQLAFLPAHRSLRTINLFIQDEIQLVPDRLYVTVGSKVEHNAYSGIDVQPNIRLSWKVRDHSQLWTAVSQAARTPSRIDREFFTPANAPLVLAGGPNFDSEKVTAYELGYRGQLADYGSMAATVFYNDYRSLRNLESNAAGAYVLSNRMQGETYGLEMWGEIRPNKRWRIQAGYLLLHKNLRLPADTTDPLGIAAAGNDPRYQWSLRSLVDLSHNLEWDLSVRRVGALPSPKVPAYTAFDMRLAWKPTSSWDLALVAQNMLDASHLEFATSPLPAEVRRSIFVKSTWKF